jgi:two-component system response regulator DesR
MSTRPLSPRELSVLRLAASGLSQKAIAINLGLSQWTVRDFAAKARSKMGAASTTHAVFTAQARGLL